MANNIYTAGLNNVGSYQVSGIPFLSGGIDATSGLTMQFPYVTRWVVVNNSGSADLNISLNENGAGTGNYYTLTSGQQSPRLEVKITALGLEGGTSGGVSVMAGMTNLPVSRIDNISPSGSNWSGSVGVG
jgi:hypothetical protein